MADQSEMPIEEKTTRRRSDRKTSLNSFVVQRNAKIEKRDKVKKVSDILKKPECERTIAEKALVKKLPDIVKASQKNAKRLQDTKDRALEIEDEPEDLARKCDQLAELIGESSRIVLYTGAGISTAASIPDYRGPNGVWTLLKKGQELSAQDLSDAEPTFTHMSITKLFRTGRVRHIVSQNCDGLHIRSGYPRYALSEVHGNMFIECCYNCEPHREYIRLFDVTENTGVRRHSTKRKCRVCGKYLTDTIVHFGEKGKIKSPYRWKEAVRAAKSSDLILCLGTSLKILRRYTCLWCMDKRPKERPKLVIVNLQWTPKDDVATLKINGRCDDVMRSVMEKLEYNVPEYRREFDPIFKYCTPLRANEKKTTAKKILVPPSMPSKASVKAAVAKSSKSKKKMTQSTTTTEVEESGLSPQTLPDKSQPECQEVSVKEENVDSITPNECHSHSVKTENTDGPEQFRSKSVKEEASCIEDIKVECNSDDDDDDDDDIGKNISSSPSSSSQSYSGGSHVNKERGNIDSSNDIKNIDITSASVNAFPTRAPCLEHSSCLDNNVSDHHPLLSEFRPVSTSFPASKNEVLNPEADSLAKQDSIGVLLVSQPPECLTDVCSLDLNSENPSVFPICRIELPAVDETLLDTGLGKKKKDNPPSKSVVEDVEVEEIEGGDDDNEGLSTMSEAIPSTVVVDLESMGNTESIDHHHPVEVVDDLSPHSSKYFGNNDFALGDQKINKVQCSFHSEISRSSGSGSVATSNANEDVKDDKLKVNTILDLNQCVQKENDSHKVCNSLAIDSIPCSQSSQKHRISFPLSPLISDTLTGHNGKKSPIAVGIPATLVQSAQSVFISSVVKNEDQHYPSSNSTPLKGLPHSIQEAASLTKTTSSQLITPVSKSVCCTDLVLDMSSLDKFTSSPSVKRSAPDPSSLKNTTALIALPSSLSENSCVVNDTKCLPQQPLPCQDMISHSKEKKMADSFSNQRNSNNPVSKVYQFSSGPFTMSASLSSSFPSLSSSSSSSSFSVPSSNPIVDCKSGYVSRILPNTASSHSPADHLKLQALDNDSSCKSSSTSNQEKYSEIAKSCSVQNNTTSCDKETMPLFCKIKHENGVLPETTPKRIRCDLENTSSKIVLSTATSTQSFCSKEGDNPFQNMKQDDALSITKGFIASSSEAICSKLSTNKNLGAMEPNEPKPLLAGYQTNEVNQACPIPSYNKSAITSYVLNMDDLDVPKHWSPFSRPEKLALSLDDSLNASLEVNAESASTVISKNERSLTWLGANAQERAFSPESVKPNEAMYVVSKVSRHSDLLEHNITLPESTDIPFKADTINHRKSSALKDTQPVFWNSTLDFISPLCVKKPPSKRSQNHKSIVLKADWGTPLTPLLQQQHDVFSANHAAGSPTPGADEKNLKRPHHLIQDDQGTNFSPTPTVLSKTHHSSSETDLINKKARKTNAKTKQMEKETGAKSTKAAAKRTNAKTNKTEKVACGKSSKIDKGASVKINNKTDMGKGVKLKQKKKTSTVAKKKSNPVPSSTPGWFGKGLAIKLKRKRNARNCST